MAELFTLPLYADTNLKGYYRFESGNLTVDASGHLHVLTAISDPAETTGRYGGGVDLDSNDAYSISDGADFKPTGVFSVGGWVKGTTNAFRSIFQSFAQNTNIAGITFIINQSTGRIRLVSGKNTGTTLGTDYQECIGITDLRDGNFHLVIGIWDGANLKVYVDGILEGTVAWANAPAYQATNYVRVGCANSTGTDTNFFTGQLDEVFFFNGKSLTADEVMSLFAIVTNLTDTVSFTDTIAKVLNRAFTETAVAFTSLITSGRLITPTFTDTVHFTEVILRFLNGASSAWKKVRKSLSQGWTKGEKP